MEQHPVPQQISSYQFRLVGDMTLKQFLQLAGGALISLLVYATGLPFIIKWPLIIFFAGAGAALAFLPFQERPLEQWVVAFFRSIYSPTLYVWRREEKMPVFFQEEGEPIPGATAPTTAFVSKLEEAEKLFMKGVTQFLGTPTQPQTPPVAAPTPFIKPITPLPLKQTIFTGAPKIQKQVIIPTSTPTSIAPQGFRPQIVTEPEKKEETPQQTIFTRQVGQVLTCESTQPAYAARFSLEAAPPTPPTQPNTITGQVMDDAGKIVEGAILEVADEAGRPVRALRTNRAGHFIVVTPLIDGNYKINVEKEGFLFDPLTFTAKGEVIAPIAIRARQKILS
jgi:hypothetical protein